MRRILGIIALGLPLLAGCGAGPQPAATASSQAGQAAATARTSAATVAPTAQAAATQVAPTVQAAATQLAPTARAAATQLAPTVQAAATQVAPTVQAAATQLAPTVQAALTRVATPAAVATAVAPAAGTAAALSPIQIVGATLGVPDTTLTLKNASGAAVDMSGWGLRVGDATAALPGNAKVGPGGTLTVHTTTGSSTDSDIYLGQAATTLVTNLRPGQRVALIDAQGRPVSAMTLP